MKKLAVVLLGMIVLCSCAKPITQRLSPISQRNIKAEGYLDVNADNPGETQNIKSSIVYGKFTIIEFTSPGCIACYQIKPFLKQMNSKRPDIVVRSFNVNREGVDGIDWESPLAEQYNLHSLPAFKIFNDKGVQIADGQQAGEEVRKVINQDILKAGRSEGSFE